MVVVVVVVVDVDVDVNGAGAGDWPVNVAAPGAAAGTATAEHNRNRIRNRNRNPFPFPFPFPMGPQDRRRSRCVSKPFLCRRTASAKMSPHNPIGYGGKESTMSQAMLSALRSFTLLPLLVLPLAAENVSGDLKEGAPDLKSAGPLAFGPPGILFVADPQGASIFAIDTGDRGPAAAGKELKIESIDEKIAGLLGTSGREVAINDLAVNPASGKAYLSVSRGLGPNAAPVIVRVSGASDLQVLPLEKVRFAKVQLADAPAVQPASAEEGTGKGKGQRRGNPRLESITDLAFVEGQLLVAGLSNEEFSSTLRSIPYPFKLDSLKEGAKGTSVEIYHGSHGKLETNSPVRTFTPFVIGGEPHLFAAYTCTPLVTIPLSKLKPGAHLKGKTVAELGNGNRPLDMVVYKKDGKDYLLIANSRRGIMKVATDGVEKTESIAEPVKDTKGLTYETVSAWKGIDQLDRLDEKSALVVRKTDAGSFVLETLPLP